MQNLSYIFFTSEDFDNERKARKVWNGAVNIVGISIDKPLSDQDYLPAKIVLIAKKIKTFSKLAKIWKNRGKVVSLEDLANKVDLSDVIVGIDIFSGGFLKKVSFYQLPVSVLKLKELGISIVFLYNKFKTDRIIDVVSSLAKEAGIDILCYDENKLYGKLREDLEFITKEAIIDEGLSWWHPSEHIPLFTSIKGEQFFFMFDKNGDPPFFIFENKQDYVLPLFKIEVLRLLSVFTRKATNITPAITVQPIPHPYILKPQYIKQTIFQLYKYYNVLRFNIFLFSRESEVVKKFLTLKTPKETLVLFYRLFISPCYNMTDDEVFTRITKDIEFALPLVLKTEEFVKILTNEEYILEKLNTHQPCLSFLRTLTALKEYQYCNTQNLFYSSTIRKGVIYMGLKMLGFSFEDFKNIVSECKRVESQKERKLSRINLEQEKEKKLLHRLSIIVGPRQTIKLVKRNFFNTIKYTHEINQFCYLSLFFHKLKNGRRGFKMLSYIHNIIPFLYLPDYKPSKPKLLLSRIFKHMIHYTNYYSETEEFVAFGVVRDNKIYIHPAFWLPNDIQLSDGFYFLRIYNWQVLGYFLSSPDYYTIPCIKEIHSHRKLSLKLRKLTKFEKTYGNIILLRNQTTTYYIDVDMARERGIGCFLPLTSIPERRKFAPPQHKINLKI